MSDCRQILLKCSRCKHWGAMVCRDGKMYAASCENCPNTWITQAWKRILSQWEKAEKAEDPKPWEAEFRHA